MCNDIGKFFEAFVLPLECFTTLGQQRYRTDELLAESINLELY
ncbi:hypothetical protein [Salinibaculum rarum]|nr:hypothetical protein [Salinibaculum sp. KK48]